MMDLAMKSLVDEVKIARQNYDNAEPDFINAATYDLLAAEENLNNYIREKKYQEQIEKTFIPAKGKSSQGRQSQKSH